MPSGACGLTGLLLSVVPFTYWSDRRKRLRFGSGICKQLLGVGLTMPAVSTLATIVEPPQDLKDISVDIGTCDSTTSGSSSTSPQPLVQASTSVTGDFRSFAWYDVRCSYERKAANGKREEVEVLHGISGHLESGHMLAVLGPSGAGKSCLLDILAGRKSVGRFESTRVVDNAPVSSAYFKAHSAYVTQEDTFHPTQSVMEAVMFQAHLRLDRRMGGEEKAALVSRLIEEVGLGGKEHQSVGGPLPGGLVIRGLSGGEKRRLSLCCGTITNPRLLFLDEPTSGLDSFAALVVMRLLHTYGKRGMMIVCTIHQPRPAIWALFDKVMVLSQGHLMFFGDACRAEPWFVQSLGYPRPANTSVVDYVLDLVSVNFNKDEEAVYGSITMRSRDDVASASEAFLASRHFAECVPPKPSDAPLRRTSSRYSLSHLSSSLFWDEEATTHKSHSNSNISSPDRPALSTATPQTHTRLGEQWEAVGLWWWQFRVVLARNGRSTVRNPGNLLARSFLMVLIAFMQGFVYFRVGARERGSGSVLAVAHVMGSLYYTLFAVTILPFASLSLFIFDRRFYSGEAASKLYPCSAYYLANMALETAVSCINGSLYAVIAYFLIDYPAFTTPDSIALNFAAYLAAIVVQTNTGSMILMLCALLSPNQDMAFTLAAGIDALALLTSGFVVPFPQFFYAATWLQWTAHLKYTFQALLLNCFSGTKLYPILPTLGLTSPGGVWVNLGCSLGFYAAAFCIGYVCLANLYKERR